MMAQAVSPQIDSGWMPFSFAKPEIPLIVFEVKANGSALKLNLDTGNADSLFLSEASAKRLDLTMKPTKGEKDTRDSVGNDFIPSLFDSKIKELKVGSIQRKNVTVRVSNFVDILAKNLSIEIDGNIGYKFLKDFCVQVDYPRSRLRFSPSGSAILGSVPFELGKSPWIIVTAQINQSKPAKFILDTGASSSVLDPSFVKSHGIVGTEEIPMMGATGMITAHMAHQVSISVGKRKVDGLDVAIADIVSPLSESAGIELSGVIGYDFLKGSLVSIDYPKKRIGFK